LFALQNRKKGQPLNPEIGNGTVGDQKGRKRERLYVRNSGWAIEKEGKEKGPFP